MGNLGGHPTKSIKKEKYCIGVLNKTHKFYLWDTLKVSLIETKKTHILCHKCCRYIKPPTSNT